jgi:hypothetical protein
MKDPRPLPKIDFLQPAGAAALYAPDSLAWQIYKNPVALFIGGIAVRSACARESGITRLSLPIRSRACAGLALPRT